MTAYGRRLGSCRCCFAIAEECRTSDQIHERQNCPRSLGLVALSGEPQLKPVDDYRELAIGIWLCEAELALLLIIVRWEILLRFATDHVRCPGRGVKNQVLSPGIDDDRFVAQWRSEHDELGPPGISDDEKKNFAQPLNATGVVIRIVNEATQTVLITFAYDHPAVKVQSSGLTIPIGIDEETGFPRFLDVPEPDPDFPAFRHCPALGF